MVNSSKNLGTTSEVRRPERTSESLPLKLPDGQLQFNKDCSAPHSSLRHPEASEGGHIRVNRRSRRGSDREKVRPALSSPRRAPPDAVVETGWEQPHGAEQARGAKTAVRPRWLEHIELGLRSGGRQKGCKHCNLQSPPWTKHPREPKSTHSIAPWPTRKQIL